MAKQPTIKCAKCNTPVHSETAEPQNDDIVSCPVCGINDTFKNVVQELEEYVADQSARFLAKSFRDATRGSKFLKFKENRRTKKRFRFIVDLDLR